ncbi:MAG TPA: carbohydrate porin, partial [Candidatus Acidoferrum sp.]|nr:carbohydrate porin [Candidatus Acidoferrum sp.]
PALGSMVSASNENPLSGTYRIGAWYDTEHFADEEFPDTEHHGDYGFYAVMDQTLWSDPKDEDADRTINFFARAMGTPLEDRNLLDFSMNAGFTFHEPIPHRGDDTFGIGMGYAKVSSGASDLDRDTGGIPVRSGETFVEMTYQYELTPWCELQPDFQYVFNPGGGVNDDAGNRVKDEAVFGIRMNIIF